MKLSKNNPKRYSAVYFDKTCQISKKHLKGKIVTLQFFQRSNDVTLAGMNEVLEFLKKHTDTSKYSIKYLKEGSTIKNKEVVLELEGEYKYFGIFEGILDGILTRNTSIATNSKRVVKAAGKKKVVFMGDRADHYLLQSVDGYAASVGGIKTQVTEAHIENHNGTAIGTIPHVLIQMHDGDLIEAMKSYASTLPNEKKLTALVDFNNDVITDSIKVLNEFGKKLGAIRIDTSANMVDKYFKNKKEYGVTPNLIKATRKELDKNGGKHVKIIVSSGFDEAKIKEFESKKTPVDIYGVGASILKINNHFSADAVKLDGKLIAKKGRKFNSNKKLIKL